MPPREREDHSLGVTRLLDELLREEREAPAAAPTAAALVPAMGAAGSADGAGANVAAGRDPSDSAIDQEDVLRNSLRRTAELCGGLGRQLRAAAAAAPRAEDVEDWGQRARVLEALEAEAALELHDTLDGTGDLASTAGSLGEAFRAGERRLRRLRVEVEEALKRQGADEVQVALPCPASETADGFGSTGELDLAALLAECDAIDEVTSKWRTVPTTPPARQAQSLQDIGH